MLVDEDVYNRLSNDLALLIPENGAGGSVSFEGVLRFRSKADSLGHARLGEEVGADHPFNESVFASRQIAWQKNVSRDFGSDRVKLAAELAICSLRHL